RRCLHKIRPRSDYVEYMHRGKTVAMILKENALPDSASAACGVALAAGRQRTTKLQRLTRATATMHNARKHCGFSQLASAQNRAGVHGLDESEPLDRSIVQSPRSFWRTSSSSHPPLRIGLLLDGVKLSRFFATIIEDIQASNFAKIELLIFRKFAEKPPEPTRSPVAKAARRLLHADLRKHAL